MWRRWLGIPTLFIVVILATGTDAFGVPITAPDPDSRVATIKEAGFSIVVPDTWAVIDLTKQQAAAVLKKLRKNFPEVRDELPDNPAGFARSMKLFAIDTATGELHGNVNAVLDRTSTVLPPKSEIQAYYKKAGLETDAEIVDAKIDGRSGYEINLKTAAQRQLWVIGNRGLLVFSFSSSATDDPRGDPVVAAMMDGVQLR